MTHNSTLNVFMNIAAPLFIALIYRVTWKRRIFAAVISCAVGMFVDLASSTIFGDRWIVSKSFFQSLVVLVLAVLFHFFYRSNILATPRSPYLWLLVLFSLCTIVLGMMVLDENSPHAAAISVLLLLMNFFHPKRLFVSAVDMTMILGNLLDNAVHTLAEADRKLLKVRISYAKGIIGIESENTYIERAAKKEDDPAHGLGLIIVEETVKNITESFRSALRTGLYHAKSVFYDETSPRSRKKNDV